MRSRSSLIWDSSPLILSSSRASSRAMSCRNPRLLVRICPAKFPLVRRCVSGYSQNLSLSAQKVCRQSLFTMLFAIHLFS